MNERLHATTGYVKDTLQRIATKNSLNSGTTEMNRQRSAASDFHTRGAFMTEPKLARSEYKEQKRLAAGLSRSLGYLVEMQASQIAALQLGDTRTQQFEEEISAALQTWQ